MWNALVVVWRESLEAMLVIGVMLSWIARQPDPALLRRGLWLGVGVGLGLACALGWATYAASGEFAGQALERFQLAMMLGAAVLLLHMVLWMHAHGPGMKRALEQRLERASASSGAWLGVVAITALAVAREGAETAIFLYGLGMEGDGSAAKPLFAGAGSGFGLALFTAWAMVRGARFLNVRTLFLASEFLLLLIATSLWVAAIDRMIAMDWLPALVDPLWDASAVLSDSRGVGRFLADFVGYRAQPAATVVIAIVAFWAFALWRLTRMARRRHRPEPT
ncbi:MAG: FTR1 family protein [Burkholderiaceae bacterium]|jgi:high-affinity iron transporter|nr:FTR1 family protein [Aquabacterium sp.]NUP86302.1 FTR1 family protein [Burkholderiaceae bacterium]